MQPELEFSLTPGQQSTFHDYYRSTQEQYYYLFAAGNGRKWMNARGWCCYTSRGQTAGDLLATCLYEAASLCLPGHKIRKDYSDGDPDWESDFTILKNTLCASALSENLFHDNPQDFDFLESAPGRQAIIDLHVRGIISFVNAYSK